MNRYDEKVYRTPRRKEGPTLAEQKSQLVRLKQDLEQFRARQAGASVVSTLRDRIRELEGLISKAEGAKVERAARQAERASYQDGGPDQGGSDENEAGDGGAVRSTSSRFPPRGRTGRSY